MPHRRRRNLMRPNHTLQLNRTRRLNHTRRSNHVLLNRSLGGLTPDSPSELIEPRIQGKRRRATKERTQGLGNRLHRPDRTSALRTEAIGPTKARPPRSGACRAAYKAMPRAK
jgi:hypothetical protein